MIFDSLTLHNYGLYRGEHRIALSLDDERRNITLFGGLNGAGKTTFLEALQLALYGRLSPVVQASAQPYEQILAERINRQVTQREGASVELGFRVREDGQERAYTVLRSWTGKNGKAKEYLRVSVDGRYDEVLTETWTEHAERFIPARLAPLFFFDGEKIEALADPERSTQAIRTAMEALLGLDIVTQLEADLTTVERRKIKSSEAPGANDITEMARIKELETDYITRKEAADSLNQRVAGLRNEADTIELRIQEVQRTLTAEGGDAFEGRKEIEARFEAAKQELEANAAQLCEKACGDLPLFLLLRQLQEINNRAQETAEVQRLNTLKAFVSAHNQRILEYLGSEPLASDELRNRLARFLHQEYASLFGDESAAQFSSLVDQDAVERVVHLIRQLPAEERDARRLLNEHEKVLNKVQTLERALATIPEEDAIAEILANREGLRIQQAEIRGRLSALEEEYQQACKQVQSVREQLERELHRRADGLKAMSKEERLIKHARKAMRTLAVFKRQLLQRHAGRLAQLVHESFSHLIRKEALISEIRIDPTDCSLLLFDSAGDVLAPDRLSAGERQLLAVSLLWGLARAAGRPLPIVVDTPLGRLDGIHRLNLVSRYFPSASHQVIVLSTDEEIDAELLVHLKPYIAHSYLLEYRDDLKHSVVRRGYFAEAEAAL